MFLPILIIPSRSSAPFLYPAKAPRLPGRMLRNFTHRKSMYRRCAYHFSLVDPDYYSGSGAKIQIFRLWSISQNLLIWAFLVIAQSEDMVVCYISFSNIEELQRICGNVMTKKMKIMQFLTYNSSISPLTRHCITSTYRATWILHFIYWLQRYTLCLECIMFQFLNISSL